MHPIIALWCHPRSLSTAVERLMRGRLDCVCHHEPFLYDYYVARAVRPLPHFDPDESRPADYEAIRDALRRAAETAPVFFKDMSYYVVPRILDDPDFALALRNIFLIRDPRRAIVSYHKLDDQVTQEEIGLEAQWRHLTWLEEQTGETPLVLEAEAIQADLAGEAERLWAAAGLSPAPHALSWDDDDAPPEDWSEVAGWHNTVMGSKTIRANNAALAPETLFAKAAAAAPRLHDLLAHHQPFYDKLRAKAAQAS